MAQAWPADLPDCPQTWEEEPVDVLIHTDVDIGPQKVRRRFTGGITRVRVTWTLRKEVYNALMLFWGTQLQQGVERFNFVHPYTGIDTEYYFLEPPKLKYLGPSAFQIQCIWETAP